MNTPTSIGDGTAPDDDRPATRSSFLKLPQEIRLAVYDLLAERVYHIDFRTPGIITGGIAGPLEILQVNKQINAEASPLFRAATTLLIRGLNSNNAALLDRIPQLIPNHLNGIQNLHVRFHPGVFRGLFQQSFPPGGQAYAIRVIGSLQGVVSCLPHLRRVTIACDNIHTLGQREDWLATLIRHMKNHLQDFDHIAFISAEDADSKTTKGDIEFTKRSYARRLPEIKQREQANLYGIRVLLEVIDGQNSHSVRWLTVD